MQSILYLSSPRKIDEWKPQSITVEVHDGRLHMQCKCTYNESLFTDKIQFRGKLKNSTLNSIYINDFHTPFNFDYFPQGGRWIDFLRKK